MLSRLRKIPDTVEEFTGFYIRFDLIGSDMPGFGQSSSYYPLGTALVQNVKPPVKYNHITIPSTEILAKNTETRKWINSYLPTTEEPELKVEFYVNSDNILFAAELWYRIKKYWSIELQTLILSRKNFLTVH